MRPLAVIVLLAACKPGPPCEEAPGCLIADGLAAGLLSVRIDPAGDTWIVGASPDPGDGTGPVVAHLHDGAWDRLDTSPWAGSELWWGWIAADEAVFVGNDGLILELSRDDGTLAAVDGPDAETTFFGVWGASGDDLWAVGQTAGGDGPPAIWRRTGGAWAAWEDPDLGPGEDRDIYFKVHGRGASDVWIVGTRGIALHWDGDSLVRVATDTDTPTSSAPLLTVDAGGDRPIAVGGLGNGLILEYDGSAWRDASPAFQPGFNGVCSAGATTWAVGLYGARARREGGVWISDTEDQVIPVTNQDWHGCAIDGGGGLWTVGGRIASRPLIAGVVSYQGVDEPPPLSLH